MFCGQWRKKSSKLVFARINAGARHSVKDASSSWRSTVSSVWRASDSQAASQPLFRSASSHLQQAFHWGKPGSLRGQLTIPAHRVRWMLQLGVDMLPERLPSFWICFPNLFHWWITRDQFLLYAWMRMSKEPCFSLLHLFPRSLPKWLYCCVLFFFFFAMQRREVNNTCLVVRNDISTVLSEEGMWDGWLGPLLVGSRSLAAPFEVMRSCSISASSGMGHRVSGLN